MKSPILPILVIAAAALAQSPEPKTFTVTNSVALRWDANSEPDLAGYRVHLGYAPGTRVESREAGLNTHLVWSDLQSGVTNYFTVTAHSTAGLESDPSNEISFTPSKPPSAPSGAYGVVTQVQTTVFAVVTNTFRIP